MSDDKTATATAPEPEKIKRKVKGFDIEKFEKRSLEFETEFVPPATFQEALERFGGDSEKLLKGITGVLRRQVISEAKKAALEADPNLLPSAKPINDFRNNMRLLPQFVGIEDRADQTQKIDAFIRSNENVLNALRTLCLLTIPGDDEDDDEDDSAE